MRKKREVLILASASPRRREILRRAGIAFRARPAQVDERRKGGEQPADYAVRIARAKAAGAARPGEVVLGADTIVVVGGRILGKPRNRAEAARMLRALSGRSHQVLTGICLLWDGRARAEVVSTRVWFRRLRDPEIADYVATGEPLDKAGAYAIQGRASKFVERIEGCYFNVMGLPVGRVWRLLEQRSALRWPGAC